MIVLWISLCFRWSPPLHVSKSDRWLCYESLSVPGEVLLCMSMSDWWLWGLGCTVSGNILQQYPVLTGTAPKTGGEWIFCFDGRLLQQKTVGMGAISGAVEVRKMHFNVFWFGDFILTVISIFKLRNVMDHPKAKEFKIVLNFHCYIVMILNLAWLK
jgi:hypothetical protein